MKRTQEIAQAAFPGSAAHIVSRENRVAVGKALRDKIPLMQHGRWKEAKDRPNPDQRTGACCSIVIGWLMRL
jgi:hypothetical protein